MTTQTARDLEGYHAYQIGSLSHGQDGGVKAECYYLVEMRPLGHSQGPPRLPRPDDEPAPPWAILLAGCILGFLWICMVVGAVTIGRWLVEIVGG